MVSRLLTSASQYEIERTCERIKIGLSDTIKQWYILHIAQLDYNNWLYN